jgi:hypothetical protein
MWKKWTALGLLVALLLAGCNNGVNQPPGDQLGTAEDSVNTQAVALLNDAIATFSDVLPAGLAPQATGTEPPPLTLVYNGEETVLIGGPWRPPFPWPLPNGADDLDGRPLFLTIKTKSSPVKAYVGRLKRRDRDWVVEWYGQRGAPPELRPARVEQAGQFSGEVRPPIVMFSFEPPDGVGIILVLCRRCDPQEMRTSPRIHVVTSLPWNLRERDVRSATRPNTEGFVGTFRRICCGWPGKPHPPRDSIALLFRNDVSVVVVPYDNPRVREARSVEDLIGQDLDILYVRKKPRPGGTTTDCGPNRVWCPPKEEPFYNLRLVRRERERIMIEYTRLGNPSQVVATLPAEVTLEESDAIDIGITDSIDSPGEPTLEIRKREKKKTSVYNDVHIEVGSF